MPTPWAQRTARAQQLEEERRTALTLVDPMDPVLHRPADPVEDFGSEDLDVLVHQLYVTCKVHKGLAIAAPQVGVPLQVVVVNDGSHGTVFCNPKVEGGGPLVRGSESCLSLPGRQFAVPRHKYAVVLGQDINGAAFGADVTEIHARMWQHEHDHLNGLLLAGRFPELAAGQVWKRHPASPPLLTTLG